MRPPQAAWHWGAPGAWSQVRRRTLAGLALPILVAAIAGPVAGQPAASPPASEAPAEADVLVAQAILEYGAHQYADALTTLRRALALAPDHVEALYYTGLVLIALERLDEAAVALERARTLAPQDEAIPFQLGLVYFGLKRYDRGGPLLEPFFTAHPDRDNLGYYVGFIRYQRGDYQGALEAFRAGTAADPRIQQLTRFYAALALQRLGLTARAAEEIEAAQRLLPASPLTAPAERLREAVTRAREPGQRFRIEVRAGGLYDDNVPVNPDASGDPQVQAFRRRRQESAGEIAALRLDYTLLRTVSLEATMTYSLFATVYNSLHAFDLVDQLGAVAAAYRGTAAGLPYQLSFQYAFDNLTLGGDQFVRRHTVTAAPTLLEGPHNATALQLGYQRKDFADEANLPPDDRRSGDNWSVGLTHIFRFEGDRHLLKVGYQGDVDDTAGRNFGYLGHRVLAGVQYTLPWRDLRFTYDFNVHFREYRHVNSTFPAEAPNTVKRADREFTHVVGLALPLPKNFTVVAQYQAGINRSNLDVFSFHRNVVSLFVSWSY